MGLPAVAPYPMPVPGDLPQARISWDIDPVRAALLVHDMQRHFLAPFDPSAPPVPDLLANVSALLDGCRRAGVPVLYSAQPPGQDPVRRGLLQEVWGDGIAAGSGGERIVDAVAPRDGEPVVTKWRYSALVRTDLLARLRDAGRDQLLICGVYTHIGCVATACHAFMEDVRSVVVADATADFSAARHRAALEWAGACCAGVTFTADALARISVPPAGLGMARMRRDLAAALRISAQDLGDHDDLLDHGLDSIRMIELVSLWRTLGPDLAVEELVEAEPTLSAWWEVVRSAAPRSPA